MIHSKIRNTKVLTSEHTLRLFRLTFGLHRIVLGGYDPPPSLYFFIVIQIYKILYTLESHGAL